MDKSRWTPDPENPEKEIWNRDPNFKSDWIKLIEKETRLRKEVMKRVIKSRGEKIPKVKTLKEWEEAREEQFAKIMDGYRKEADNSKDVRISEGLLKLGRALEEEGEIPRHKICAKMMEMLSNTFDKSDVERLCPPQWKPVPALTE